MNLRKVATICIRVAGVAILLIVEDSLLWVAPVLTERAIVSSRAENFRSRCEEIKVGMNREEVVKTIHRGTYIWSESDRRTGINDDGRELLFQGYRAACTVTVDPASGKALGVHVELPGGMSFDE